MFAASAGPNAQLMASVIKRAKTYLLNSREVIIWVRQSPRARRLTLSIEPRTGIPQLVTPQGITNMEVDQFLQREATWLLQRLDELPPRILFQNGAKVPVMGTICRIIHLPLLPWEVEREGNEIVIGGKYEELRCKLTEWMKGLARQKVSMLAEQKAGHLRCRISGIKIRDPLTRWGSCSQTGGLSFSWRLVLAPPQVMDYVVAHEVAHLKEFDHSPAFWMLVKRLCPNYQKSKNWLAKYGSTLLRYG